jgi:hypothetical protein
MLDEEKFRNALRHSIDMETKEANALRKAKWWVDLGEDSAFARKMMNAADFLLRKPIYTGAATAGGIPTSTDLRDFQRHFCNILRHRVNSETKSQRLESDFGLIEKISIAFERAELVARAAAQGQPSISNLGGEARNQTSKTNLNPNTLNSTLELSRN